MQIDFHHAVTYAVSRLAGLPHAAADIVSHSAQYVDDAVNAGVIRFDNGALYTRISSAHKALDYRNFETLANELVWIPFHFLPGNEGASEDVPFVDRLVCRPNSAVALAMVRLAIEGRGAPHALHRLGVTMHSYVDTWAHQGFAGIIHPINQVKDVRGPDGRPDERLIERLESYFVSREVPLGHGAALSNPDRPYHVWSYENGAGARITRDNPKDFLDAAEQMCKALRRYVAGDPGADVPGLLSRDAATIDSLLRGLKGDADERHAHWIQAIADGQLSFGKAQIAYVAKGEGSWKHAALGTTGEVDTGRERHAYKASFLTSDWKRFHDALQAHRFAVLTEVLPSFGICAA